MAAVRASCGKRIEGAAALPVAAAPLRAGALSRPPVVCIASGGNIDPARFDPLSTEFDRRPFPDRGDSTEPEDVSSFSDPDGIEDGRVDHGGRQAAGLLERSAPGEMGEDGRGQEAPGSVDVPGDLFVAEDERASPVEEDIDGALFEMPPFDQAGDRHHPEEDAGRPPSYPRASGRATR